MKDSTHLVDSFVFGAAKKGRKRSGICPNKLTGANGPAEPPTLSVDDKVILWIFTSKLVRTDREHYCLALFGSDYVTVVLPGQKKK